MGDLNRPFASGGFGASISAPGMTVNWPEAEIHARGPRAPLSDWFSRAKFALLAVNNNAQIGPRYRLGVVSTSVSNPASPSVIYQHLP